MSAVPYLCGPGRASKHYIYSLSHFNKSEKDIVHLKRGKKTNPMHIFTFRVNNNKIHMTKKKKEIANRGVVSKFDQVVVITFL